MAGLSRPRALSIAPRDGTVTTGVLYRWNSVYRFGFISDIPVDGVLRIFKSSRVLRFSNFQVEYLEYLVKANEWCNSTLKFHDNERAFSTAQVYNPAGGESSSAKFAMAIKNFFNFDFRTKNKREI